MTDPIKTVGKILTGGEERDCIHVAIFPAIAAEDLWPGREVGLVYGTKDQVKHKDSAYGLKPIGVVDPFLSDDTRSIRVEKGQRCWVFLFPGTVTGMRHHWSLPAIDDQKLPANESEKWLRGFADKWNMDYDKMIAASQEHEGYTVAMGIDLHSAGELDPGDEELFWRHVENLMDRKFDDAHRRAFIWSCSC